MYTLARILSACQLNEKNKLPHEFQPCCQKPTCISLFWKETNVLYPRLLNSHQTSHNLHTNKVRLIAHFES